MLLCTKIRLPVSEADAAALEVMPGQCRGRYNWWVLRLRDGGERWPGWTAAKATREARKDQDPELRQVYGNLVQEVRLDTALAAFLRRVTAGEEEPGFPRVRPRQAFFRLGYPSMYLTVEGDRLSLPTGGGGTTGIPQRHPTSVARLPEPAPTEYREVAIARDACGHSSASCVSERLAAPRKEGGLLALDLGIKTWATGLHERSRVYHIGGFKGLHGTPATSTRCVRSGIAAARTRGAPSTGVQSTSASPSASAPSNGTVCTKPRSSSPTDCLRARW